MDDVTQQNAALVEQAAAQSLQEMAHALAQLVSAFCLDAPGPGRAAISGLSHQISQPVWLGATLWRR